MDGARHDLEDGRELRGFLAVRVVDGAHVAVDHGDVEMDGHIGDAIPAAPGAAVGADRALFDFPAHRVDAAPEDFRRFFHGKLVFAVQEIALLIRQFDHGCHLVSVIVFEHILSSKTSSVNKI